MATYPLKEDASGNLARCAACNATAIAQIDSRATAGANTVCARCGMTLVDPPFDHETFGYGFSCVRTLLGYRAAQEFTDLQEEVVRACLLVLSTYAQRFRDEAALMSEEIGRKNGAEWIDSEQLRWAA